MPSVMPSPWAALLCFIGGVSTSAVAQDGAYDPANYAWQAGAIRHAQRMRAFFDSDRGQQNTPPVISKFEIDFDPSGLIATTQPGGPTQTSQNAFFANLGTNGRTCFSCHEPQNGWSVSAASVQARFYTSYGNDPIFRLVDGATCPNADVSSIDAKRQAYSLLLHKGLIRIGLPVPATIPGSTVPTEYRIVSVTDPYGCNTNPTTGLTSFGPANPTAGIVSVYRRPLPSTNLGFLTADHVGRSRADPCATIDRRHTRPCAGQRRSHHRAATTDRRLRIRNLHCTALRPQSEIPAMRPALRVAPTRWRSCLPDFMLASMILSLQVCPLPLEIRRACRSHRRSLICIGLGSASAVLKTKTKALSNIAGPWRAAKSYSTTRLSILPT